LAEERGLEGVVSNPPIDPTGLVRAETGARSDGAQIGSDGAYSSAWRA